MRPVDVECMPSVAARAEGGQVEAPVLRTPCSQDEQNVAAYLEEIKAEISRLLTAHASRRPDGSYRMALNLKPSQARAIQAEILALQKLGQELEELLTK